jgi:hypothetical protein
MKRQSRFRRTIFLAAAASVIASAASVYGLTRSSHSAVAGAAPPAMQAMAAMHRPDLALSDAPGLVKRLPPGMEAAPGSVHELVFGLGTMGFAVYAWPHGNSGSICLVSTHGGGGCLDRFQVPFDISISDFDQLGAGQPALVWGPVSDDVASVAVTVAGQTYQATIKNNIAFYELASSSLMPGDVQKVVATLKDGQKINIRV